MKLIANWWAWELVPSKIGGAQQGDSIATMWAGTSPGRGHQLAPPHWRNFSGETYLTRNLPWTTSYMGSGKGGVLNWQSGREKQWSTKLNWASKLQIMVTKAVIGVQGSDHKDQRSRQLQLMATRAHVQAHGEASPCGHATDHRDRRAHSLEINLA